MVIKLLILIFLFSFDSKVSELTFSRDNLRVAHQQWVDLNNAELVDAGNLESDIYGFAQVREYETIQGRVELKYYINLENEIYDVGLVQPEEVNQVTSAKTDRIVSRVLWGSLLENDVLISTLWFLGTGSVQMSYDDRIGSQSELLKAFILDKKTSGNQPSLSGFRADEETATVDMSNGSQLLSLEFKPNLNLYLNGQIEVIRQKIAASLSGNLNPDPILEMHPFHDFNEGTDSFSARFIARDQSDYQIEFEQTNEGWQPKEEVEKLGYTHPLHHQIFSFWVSRNFPDRYRMDGLDSSNLAGEIIVEGVSNPFTLEDDSYINAVGWLGREMLTHVEVSSFQESETEINAITYILYYDPDLQYQHMIRVRDKFLKTEGNTDWASSEMHILPGIRLDNIGNVTGRSNFPIKDYEQLFEVDVTN